MRPLTLSVRTRSLELRTSVGPSNLRPHEHACAGPADVARIVHAHAAAAATAAAATAAAAAAAGDTAGAPPPPPAPAPTPSAYVTVEIDMDAPLVGPRAWDIAEAQTAELSRLHLVDSVLDRVAELVEGVLAAPA